MTGRLMSNFMLWRRFRMPRYVDGFVLPSRRRTSPPIAARRRRPASLAGARRARVPRVRRRRPDIKCGARSLARVKLKPGETVVFAWIVYKSRAHRDRVNAKVMKDPRLGR